MHGISTYAGAGSPLGGIEATQEPRRLGRVGLQRPRSLEVGPGRAASALSLDADEAAGLSSFYALHPLVERSMLGVGRSWLGGRVSVASRILRERRRDGDAYFLVGARAAVRVAGGEIDLNGTNLTDETYQPFPEIPRNAAGRALSVGYRLEVGGR